MSPPVEPFPKRPPTATQGGGARPALPDPRAGKPRLLDQLRGALASFGFFLVALALGSACSKSSPTEPETFYLFLTGSLSNTEGQSTLNEVRWKLGSYPEVINASASPLRDWSLSGGPLIGGHRGSYGLDVTVTSQTQSPSRYRLSGTLELARVRADGRIGYETVSKTSFDVTRAFPTGEAMVAPVVLP